MRKVKPLHAPGLADALVRLDFCAQNVLMTAAAGRSHVVISRDVRSSHALGHPLFSEHHLTTVGIRVALISVNKTGASRVITKTRPGAAGPTKCLNTLSSPVGTELVME